MAATNQLRLTFEIVGNDIKTLNDKIKALVESVGSSTPETIKEIIDNQTNDIRDVVGALLVKVNQLNESIQNVKPSESAVDYSNDIQQITTQLTSIEEQLQELNVVKSNISSVETKVTDVEGLVNSTKSELSAYQTRNTNQISTIESQLTAEINRLESELKQISSSNVDLSQFDWKRAFFGSTKLADYKENPLCTLPAEWKEVRVEYQMKNSTQPEFILAFNDIQSKQRKAYSLGNGIADIVMETDGAMKCFSVTEPNVRIRSVFWR